MQTNQAALDLIKQFESWRADAYPDPAVGWNLPTIGFGHTTAAGPPTVSRGLSITRADGEMILMRDLVAVEKNVADAVKVPLTANQFGALVSFTFNLGAGNLRKSTLLKKLNAGDYDGAAAEFGKWNKAAGKVMAGLTRRRAAEAALFRKLSVEEVPPPPDIEPIDPPPVNVKPVSFVLTSTSRVIIAVIVLAIIAYFFLR